MPVRFWPSTQMKKEIMTEGTRVSHPNLGYGKVFDVLGANTLVKFDICGVKTVHTRLLTIVTEEDIKISLPPIKKEKIESEIRKSKRLRNETFLSLLKNGYSYVEISNKFKVSRQTVATIAKANGIDYMKDRKNITLKLIEDLKKDIENNLSYNEIKLKNKLTKENIRDMYSRGFLFIRTFKAKRNNKMASKYKSGVIAKNLRSKKSKEVTSIGRVYGVVSKEQKVYKYPKIKRGCRGLFEDKEVIDIITKLKKKNKSCNEIADALNKAGHRTPYGLKYNWHHVQHRATKIKQKKHKIKNLTYS